MSEQPTTLEEIAGFCQEVDAGALGPLGFYDLVRERLSNDGYEVTWNPDEEDRPQPVEGYPGKRRLRKLGFEE